jgi:hypothetical protein
MFESDFPSDIFDLLDQEILLDSLSPNKRVAVRYRRTDIKAVIKIRSLFFPSLVLAQLQNISSRGAAVLCSKKLRKKTKVTLFLLFSDGRRFDINATVVYTADVYTYGLKFDHYQKKLADHILLTQTELIFS